MECASDGALVVARREGREAGRLRRDEGLGEKKNGGVSFIIFVVALLLSLVVFFSSFSASFFSRRFPTVLHSHNNNNHYGHKYKDLFMLILMTKRSLCIRSIAASKTHRTAYLL